MEDNLGIPLIGIFMLFMSEEAFRDVLLRTFGNQLLLHELSCVVFGRLIEDPYDVQECLRSVCVVAFTVITFTRKFAFCVFALENGS